MSKSEKSVYNDSVSNFMGGVSFNLKPLETLKLVATSSIFGESSFYRPNTTINNFNNEFEKYFILDLNDTTNNIFISSVNKALDDDFIGTLRFALELRTEFKMRLNPSVIFVLAMNHEKRIDTNISYPGLISDIGQKIIRIPSDMTNMFDFYLKSNGSKNKMPSCLKRLFAKKLESFSRYHLAKYKSKSLIDIIRISHANSTDINELMKTGTIIVNDDEKTWEVLRSSGKSWSEILDTTNIPHMALLRNLRGIFTEKISETMAFSILEKLEKGVSGGNQFPFRYYSAYKEIYKIHVEFKKEILDSLNKCIDLSMKNFPVLKGVTYCLSDNSGSSHGAITSEYGSTRVSEIANLSSIMTALNSEQGFVGTFGDKLIEEEIKKDQTVFESLENLKTNVGASTENGIWLFFRDSIRNKRHIDNIFIYSDQQAGYGGLYGKNPNDYKEFSCKRNYIDVLALVKKYREEVNPKVNVFSVQVAGYNNSLIPQNIYRGAILSGWTGKEVLFAQKIIDFWNEKEKIS